MLNGFELLPTGINEGLSVFIETRADAGGYDARERNDDRLVRTAARTVALPRLRDLTTCFPGTPADKELAYAVSGTAVGYLIDIYGSDKMAMLIATYKEGTRSTGTALTTVYGITLQDLDAAWQPDLASRPAARTDSTLLICKSSG